MLSATNWATKLRNSARERQGPLVALWRCTRRDRERPYSGEHLASCRSSQRTNKVMQILMCFESDSVVAAGVPATPSVNLRCSVKRRRRKISKARRHFSTCIPQDWLPGSIARVLTVRSSGRPPQPPRAIVRSRKPVHPATVHDADPFEGQRTNHRGMALALAPLRVVRRSHPPGELDHSRRTPDSSVAETWDSPPMSLRLTRRDENRVGFPWLGLVIAASLAD